MNHILHCFFLPPDSPCSPVSIFSLLSLTDSICGIHCARCACNSSLPFLVGTSLAVYKAELIVHQSHSLVMSCGDDVVPPSPLHSSHWAGGLTRQVTDTPYRFNCVCLRQIEIWCWFSWFGITHVPLFFFFFFFHSVRMFGKLYIFWRGCTGRYCRKSLLKFIYLFICLLFPFLSFPEGKVTNEKIRAYMKSAVVLDSSMYCRAIRFKSRSLLWKL